MVAPSRRDHTEPSSVGLDALAYRLAGALLLLGGLVLLGVLAAIEHLDAVFRVGGLAYIVPGTAGRHVIEASVVPILAGAGGLLVALGMAGLVISRRAVAFPARPAPVPESNQPARRLRRSGAVLVAGLAVLAVTLLLRK